MSEIGRIKDVHVEGRYEFHCGGCDQLLWLWFNGGELDETECCGFRYTLESPTIDFVVYKP